MCHMVGLAEKVTLSAKAIERYATRIGVSVEWVVLSGHRHWFLPTARRHFAKVYVRVERGQCEGYRGLLTAFGHEVIRIKAFDSPENVGRLALAIARCLEYRAATRCGRFLS